MQLDDHNSPFLRVLVLRPGEELRAEVVPNTLEGFQALVGGYIETFTVSADLVLICNEEWRLLDLPHCATLFGRPFCGPVVFAGFVGEDFCSIPRRLERTIRCLVGGCGDE